MQYFLVIFNLFLPMTAKCHFHEANSLRAKSKKWSNTLTQFALNVVDQSVGLALKGFTGTTEIGKFETGFNQLQPLNSFLVDYHHFSMIFLVYVCESY